MTTIAILAVLLGATALGAWSQLAPCISPCAPTAHELETRAH